MTEVDHELIGHMSDPKNYGELDDPDAIGFGINPENDEKVVIYLRIRNDDEPTIEDIRFQAIGCMTTVVAGSVITDEAKGISFETADELIAVALGMLEHVPPSEAACTEMVTLALRAAMDTYNKRCDDPEFGAITYTITNSCEPKESPEEIQ